MDAANSTPVNKPRLPREVWVLGLVSMFTDMSSEFIHSVLPFFLATGLGASALSIGLIEGAAEGLALATKVFSGYLSDKLGKRKGLIIFGYGLATLTKPLIPMASSVTWILGARLLDRIGKGIRGAPRDALLADVVHADQRGAAYGLRQSLDTIGAFLGPAMAIAALIYFAGDLRSALWVAVIPGIFAVALLFFGIDEPKNVPRREVRLPITRAALSALGGLFWRIVLVGAVLTFARSTEAFLVLRAAQVGLTVTWLPLALVVMAAVFTITAYPAGAWADRGDRRWILAAGMIALLAADLVLAAADSRTMLFIGVGLWGLHMGLTQGIFAAYIADAAPGELRGTAFGVFYLVSGAVLLVSSGTSGYVWDRFSSVATFELGAACAAIAALSVLALPPRRKA